MSEFAVVINYQFDGEESQSAIIDTVNDVDISRQSTITSQPIVNGDEVSDHMFRQGASMTISGACSLNGSQGTVINTKGSKLANFEALFERIQKEGVRCTIYKIKVGSDNNVRFLHRENMVLESIQFKEKINGLNFTLSFKQVLVADVVEYDVDTDDAYLPNVTEPATLSFTESLLNYDKIDSTLLEILEQESLWTTEFKNFLSSIAKPGLQAIILGAAATAIAVTLAALNTTPIGWVLTTVGLTVTAVVILVKGIVEAIQEAKRRRKYAIEQFKFYNNDKKDADELQRFNDFIQSIHNEFESLNTALHIYQVSENVPQEAMITVTDDYYIFTFTKNNTNGNYSLRISNVDESNTKELPDITTSPTDFYELSSANCLIKTNNNQRIYLLAPSEDKTDLTKYFIVVADINPDDFNAMITKIIRSKIFKDANAA